MEEKVQAAFYSKCPKYQISSHPILVPTKLKRYGLSEIVSHLLGLEEKIPFDFIIDGKFLRTSLMGYLDANSLSTENILKIEFVELALPPKDTSTLIHDDWISSVKIHHSNAFILTGSFDSYLRVWDDKGKVIDSCSVGKHAVKATAWLSDSAVLLGDAQNNICAFNFKDNVLEKSFRCQGHQGSITDLAVSKDGKRFASTSWDKTIKLWSSNPEENVEMETVVKKMGKRQKMDEHAVKSEILSLDGHAGPASCILFDPLDSNHLYSGSWDHSVRIWDMEAESNIHTMNCEKIVVCMEHSLESNMIVTGHEDGILRLWDPRSKDGIIVKMKLSSHKNWISGIAQSPTTSHLFASSSYDGTLKVWDIRSTVPLYTLTNSDSKLFSVDWSSQYLATGGEEGKLHIYNSN